MSQGAWASMMEGLRADHAAIRQADEKYRAEPRPARLLPDLVQRIGLQMMFAYRVMRFWRAIGFGLMAKISSRLIRHLYGAEIHWDADLAPGIVIVHGTGLVISHAAKVERGCILFQHVTLGESIDPVSRVVGAPHLLENVHVGAGATLLGPITVGRDSKVMASAVLMQSVPERSLVEIPPPVIRPRDPARRLTDEESR